jgi:hypothetical protein
MAVIAGSVASAQIRLWCPASLGIRSLANVVCRCGYRLFDAQNLEEITGEGDFTHFCANGAEIKFRFKLRRA